MNGYTIMLILALTLLAVVLAFVAGYSVGASLLALPPLIVIGRHEVKARKK